MKAPLPFALLILVFSTLTTTSPVSLSPSPSAPTSSSLSQPIYNLSSPARPIKSTLPDNGTISPFLDPEDKRGGGGSSGGGGGGGHGSSSTGGPKGGGSSGSTGVVAGGRPVGAGVPLMAVDGNLVIYKVAILWFVAFWMRMMLWV